MQKPLNEHYEIWGADLEMPLIEDCGYNGWNIAERLSWHSHEGFELVLLLDGQSAWEFMDGGRCELAGGEFFFKLPHQIHRAADEVTTPCKMCWIVFDPTLPGACANTTFLSADLEYLVKRYHEDERKIFTFSPSLRPLLDNFWRATVNLHSQYLDGNAPSRQSYSGQLEKSPTFKGQTPEVALLRSYICQILLETARQAMVGPPKKPDDFVAAGIAYMEANFRDDLNIDQIAKHLGLSRSYLHTVFRDGIGQTPIDYLQRTRIKAAELQLGKTSNSVTDIAANVGFSSSQYFSKVFRKYTGQTPQEYRKSKMR